MKRILGIFPILDGGSINIVYFHLACGNDPIRLIYVFQAELLQVHFWLEGEQMHVHFTLLG